MGLKVARSEGSDGDFFACFPFTVGPTVYDNMNDLDPAKLCFSQLEQMLNGTSFFRKKLLFLGEEFISFIAVTTDIKLHSSLVCCFSLALRFFLLFLQKLLSK